MSELYEAQPIDVEAGAGAVADRLELWISRSLPPVALCVALALCVPPFVGSPTNSYLIVAAVGVAGAALAAIAERPPDRRLFLAIFGWAFLARLVVLSALWAVSVPAGGPFLGPDSSTYFATAVDLAAAGFRLPAHPTVVFGTLDVGQYYLFAACIRVLGADLFALQLFNCVCTSLVAPLMFVVVRRFAPGKAILIGAAVALYPSLVVISASDLYKDPSLALAVAIVLRAGCDLDQNDGSSWGWGGAALLSLLYMRVTRSYLALHLEVAAVCALIYQLWKSGWTPAVRIAVVRGSLIIALAEVLPVSVGWPTTPVVVWAQIRHTAATPQMTHVRGGVASPSEDRGDLSPLNPVSLARKFFGPFVWIVPRRLGLESFLRADYLLYPGTLMLYLLMPLAAAGWMNTALRTTIARTSPPLLVALTLLLFTYVLQYTVLNLSYRQREAMFPLLAVFALEGYRLARQLGWIRNLYAAYWAMLIAVAVTHLAVRARLGLS